MKFTDRPNDYINKNIDLLDIYNLDLKIFYESIPYIQPIIEEIPMDNLNVLVDKTGSDIINSKERNSMIFSLENVKKFIELSSVIIISEIKSMIKS